MMIYVFFEWWKRNGQPILRFENLLFGQTHLAAEVCGRFPTPQTVETSWQVGRYQKGQFYQTHFDSEPLLGAVGMVLRHTLW